ncbi:hypothetical protein CA265_00915 [Sphingobacteriaceae bacterium GW460-11-11-14-LB5]|nr:hypothetical protein CA265_00915 [Sphingobacteriaceae bacterium GW460-11-11-14-LB5]
MEKVRIVVIVLVIAIFAGCAKNPGEPDVLLGKANLLLPLKDQPCLTGTNITATESTVAFSWQPAENAEGYDLIIKNLLTNQVITMRTASVSQNINLLLNTPYSWQVKSLSTRSSETPLSEVWKFFNAGPGQISFSPYPADMISPYMNQKITAVNGKVNLKWSGADPDKDIVGYSVYFGTIANNLNTIIDNKMVTEASDISVVPGNVYYWKVITRDARSNISDSGTISFTVN